MKLKSRFFKEDNYWHVELNWEWPIKCDPEQHIYLPEEADNQYGLYRILRDHHKSYGIKKKTIYIGIAFKQTLKSRVYQYLPDKIESWKRKGHLWITFGQLITYNHKHVRKRYEEVESLLTYFMQPKENIRKKMYLPEVWYHLKNNGWRGDLPREILYPDLRINW